MMGLRPIVLDDFGLQAAVEWQLEEFRMKTGLACGGDIGLLPEDLDREVSTAVFRIFQEALANAARHAGATQVTVALRQEAGSIILEVRDDGRGITEQETNGSQSLGILGMSERAAAFGGEIRIGGEPGEGTTLILTVPAG
jgi:signal transduction histidine kinase